MRHAISWSDLRGLRVAVWGMGTEGTAGAARLRAMGVEPLEVDDAPRSPEVVATDDGGLDAMIACDVVVKSPGISRYRADVAALSAAGVRVVGGLGLWVQEADRARVVCITGTKGKSTTATVLGHLLRGLGRHPFVGGNLGLPPFAPEVATDHDVWVIETSSYQATDLAVAPGVVCLTSLSPDHLPWHGDVATYYADKLSIATLPGPHVTLANAADPELRRLAAHLGPDVTWVADPPQRPRWLDALGLLGAHNDRNAMLAVACLDALGIRAAEDDLARVAPGMAPLDSRLQPVGVVEGVTFVDDSLSTNVLPTIAALQAFAGRPVALLVGGQDRGIDYTPLGAFLRGRVAPTLVLALPTNGPRLAADLGDVGPTGAVEQPVDLAQAVQRGFAWARPAGGVVLLSPAAPSFDLFTDFRHRAATFVAGMHACGTAAPAGS